MVTVTPKGLSRAPVAVPIRRPEEDPAAASKKAGGTRGEICGETRRLHPGGPRSTMLEAESKDEEPERALTPHETF